MTGTTGSEFQNRVAFITGGGRGIGKDFGRALSELGGCVVVAEADMAAGEAAAAEFRASGGQAMAVACDVSDEDQVALAVARTVEEYGGIDILINNAALHSSAYNRSLQVLGVDTLRKLFDVNVMGPIICALTARPHMAGRENAIIINIASTTSYGISSAYGVSKAAVRALTLNFAREFKADGIRANAIAPGLVFTQTLRTDSPKELLEKHIAEHQILDLAGEEQDITEMMLFLVSSKARFITGETYRVSGGHGAYV
jgi:3-oxoacyl-[acyl-carrier protein] reductase